LVTGLWLASASLAAALAVAAVGPDKLNASLFLPGPAPAPAPAPLSDRRVDDLVRQISALDADLSRARREGGALGERIARVEDSLEGATGSVAAASPAVAAAEADAPASRTVFGIHLASAADLPAVKARWATLAKSVGLGSKRSLRPVAALQETAKGTPEIRLIAGPFENVQDAAVVCAKLRAVSPGCAPASYAGVALGPEN